MHMIVKSSLFLHLESPDLTHKYSKLKLIKMVQYHFYQNDDCVTYRLYHLSTSNIVTCFKLGFYRDIKKDS